MRGFSYSSSSRVNSFIPKLCLPLLTSFLIVGCSSTPKVPDQAKPQKAEKATVKSEAEKRVASWKELIATKQNITEDRKLLLVNDFINRLIFVDDIDHWGQQDYWATPLETISSGGGDCEDFAIAKYFTLKYLHVSDERMRITYVKALNINKPHMVLTYFLTPESEPLVLDNLDEEIKPSSQRTDLLPIYSFNAGGLWVAKKRDSEEYVGNSDNISLWQKLLVKMQKNKESPDK
jgi:predicted transglutaminase-like cysteine proteinase